MQISITQCPSVHDETLISVHRTAAGKSYTPCTNISEQPCFQGCRRNEVQNTEMRYKIQKCGEKCGNIVFFGGGCGECRTRRSYSLDRIHVHDSYFLFPFQNNFLPQFFLLEQLFAGKFLAQSISSQMTHCNLSCQRPQIKVFTAFTSDRLKQT